MRLVRTMCLYINIDNTVVVHFSRYQVCIYTNIIFLKLCHTETNTHDTIAVWFLNGFLILRVIIVKID